MIITHMSFALFIALLITNYINIPAINTPVGKYFLIVFTLLGSLVPDIDAADSIIGRKFKPISMFLRHRGFFHSIILMVILGILMFIITQNSYYTLAIMLGFVSHLVMDGLTRAGIPAFWPSKLRIRGRFRTRSLSDWLLFLVFGIMDLLYLFLIL